MKLRLRKQASASTMEKVGWVATGIALLGLLATAAMAASSLPELKRYLKMETM
jgi:hypothetical protein